MHEMDEIDETNEMKNKKNIRGILLVALSAASFGFIPVFAKIAYSAETSTYTLLFLRFLVATVFMFVFLLVKKLPLPTKKEMLIFFSTWGNRICWRVFLLFYGAKLCFVKHGGTTFLHISCPCHAWLCRSV